MPAPPIHFAWDGEVMRPLRPALADKHFVVGQNYQLVEHHDRSGATHRHYFAALHEAWLNLPDDQAERFVTEEHLRKYALIRSGYCDERTIVCASKSEALRVMAFVKPMDTHAVVTAHQSVVCVRTAQSQSVKAMGAKAFQESKQKVLDYVAGLIGVAPDSLQREAGKAA